MGIKPSINYMALLCVQCPQYSTRLEALAYLYMSSNTMSPALTQGPLLHAKFHPIGATTRV